ncbi:MAG: alpha/beta hydrolase [Sandaracinus sp.]|nr:alpha/beta hydrolase [Sandaracinus sp.]|tara:strand:- start:2 stop:1012 length:1011 start_codon:yes stop_codon:yes gene_type:complete
MFKRLQSRLARSLVSLPEPALRKMAGKPLVVEGEALHPAFQVLFGLQKRAKRTPIEKLSLKRARREYETLSDILARPEPPAPRTRDLRVEGVPVRLHHPTPGRPAPLVVYLHGGGFVIGNLATHEAFCRRLSRTAGVAVAAVDYRLAPEHPFPAAADDCLAVVRGLRDGAKRFEIDPERVALAGDSAGGNLAAVCSQVLGRAGEGVRYQLLYYPATDASKPWPSIARFGDGFGLDKSLMDWFMDNYAGAADRTDPRLSPMKGELAASPPTRLVVGHFDPLRDEGLAYADALRDAGVEVEVVVPKDLVHAFVHATRLARVRALVDADALRLREVLRA